MSTSSNLAAPLAVQVTQAEGSALPTRAPSAKGPSIFTLADLACAMPWEDKAPISARLDFKDAVTPELFVELVDAVNGFLEWHEGNPCREGLFDKARAAIAKATGK